MTVYLPIGQMGDQDLTQDLELQKKYFRMHMTVLEMLRDRGYNIDESEGLAYIGDFDGWAEIYIAVSQLNNIYTSDKDPVKYPPIKVKFTTASDKLKVADFNEWLQEAKREGFNRMIVIGKHGIMTESARKGLSKLKELNLHVEFFEEPELVINITKHSLVPKHEVLTDEEKREFLEHYTIEEWQLPKIFLSDPVVRYYGVDVGTVLKITRKSETSGRYVTYRIVC